MTFLLLQKIFFMVNSCKRASQEIFLSKRTFHRVLDKIIVNLEELSGKMVLPWKCCLGSL